MPARLLVLARSSRGSSCRPRTGRSRRSRRASRRRATRRRCATCSPSCARAPAATSRYYKRATILRRIARRMQVNGIDDLPAYLDFLRTHPGEAGALLQDLLISVTNFFRDRDALRRAARRRSRRCSRARRRATRCASGCRPAPPARRRTRSRCCWPSTRARSRRRRRSRSSRPTSTRTRSGRRATASIRPRSPRTSREERLRRFFIKEHARLPASGASCARWCSSPRTTCSRTRRSRGSTWSPAATC